MPKKIAPIAPKKKPPAPVRIRPSMFYKYLRCPHWVYWDLYGDESERAQVDRLREMIWEHDAISESEVVSKYKDFVELPEYGDEDDLFRKTAELMAQGVAGIYHGRLIDGLWVGMPDLLVKTQLPLGRSSKFGNYIYVPYDIKSDRELRDDHRFQLAFYALILEKLQGVRPEFGHIINLDEVTLDVPINPILEDFHLTLKEIEKIISGQKPAPFLASSCKESPWFGACKRDAETCDDVCLIYKIKRADHAKLYEAGIHTVTELATTDIDTLEMAVPDMSRRKLEAIQRQAISLHEKRIIVIQSPELPEAKTEVYFDIEGDPLRGTEYLFGMLVAKGPASKGVYKKFIAEGSGEEKKMWDEFLAFVKKLPDNAPIYHYGTFERAVVARFKARYGGDGVALDRLDRNLFNLLTTVCESVALPVYFYSLKDIAKELGFKWRHKQASGVNSIIWYEEYLAAPKSVKGKKRLKDVIDYNEDDVRATLFLKRWLEKMPAPK